MTPGMSWIGQYMSLNQYIADGTVFQSEWSRQRNFELCTRLQTLPWAVIHNAPDPRIFIRNREEGEHVSDKFHILIASWSSNLRKGFNVYKYIDEHLDFSEFAVTFVGNSPLEFKNIKMMTPVGSEELAGIMCKHDAFLTASAGDPCSNTVLEAISCGLSVAYLNDGGHPELVGDGGVSFQGTDDILSSLQELRLNYQKYQKNIHAPSLARSAETYYKFIKDIHEKKRSVRTIPFVAIAKLIMSIEPNRRSKMKSIIGLLVK